MSANPEAFLRKEAKCAAEPALRPFGGERNLVAQNTNWAREMFALSKDRVKCLPILFRYDQSAVLGAWGPRCPTLLTFRGCLLPPYHELREGEARRENVVCGATPPISDAFLALRGSQHLRGEDLCSIVGAQRSVGEDRPGTGHSILCNATRGSYRTSLDKVKMKLLSMDIQNAYRPASWPQREKF